MNFSLFGLNQTEALLQIEIAGSDKGKNRKSVDEMFGSYVNEEDGFEGYNGQEFSLSITKRLVELQNGKIDVIVKEGEGTKFMVLLPFRLQKEKNPT